jgi:hypothetical protein
MEAHHVVRRVEWRVIAGSQGRLEQKKPLRARNLSDIAVRREMQEASAET